MGLGAGLDSAGWGVWELGVRFGEELGRGLRAGPERPS